MTFGSHYYVTPQVDGSKIVRDAQLSCERSGTTALVHPHAVGEPCTATVKHTVITPGKEPLVISYVAS